MVKEVKSRFTEHLGSSTEHLNPSGEAKDAHKNTDFLKLTFEFEDKNVNEVFGSSPELQKFLKPTNPAENGGEPSEASNDRGKEKEKSGDSHLGDPRYAGFSEGQKANFMLADAEKKKAESSEASNDQGKEKEESGDKRQSAGRHFRDAGRSTWKGLKEIYRSAKESVEEAGTNIGKFARYVGRKFDDRRVANKKDIRELRAELDKLREELKKPDTNSLRAEMDKAQAQVWEFQERLGGQHPTGTNRFARFVNRALEPY
ncbi:hypothetical protein [Dictyobacter aurantiacus]|uniref:Uncharacterized protein n=1 Tax=Dictyobacter aurantiacus TaxID=1936993 RepID=A0A401Z9E7_9CHLR|nr:hypothetical protein [Dictyobacter aurantiacus]GCE03500.1 hypothetical protein KDAU_08290 [Dictyobacter aurantiacus]